MVYSSFNHHHHHHDNNRYVHHEFPDDHRRNPYPHRLPPPLPSHSPYPSLPLPPPLPPPPGPPPYNQPHFTFLNPHPHRSPIDRNSSKSPSFLNRHPPHRQSSPPRFSNRSLFEKDENHRNRIPPPQQLDFPKFDYRLDPTPPRFPPPEPPHRLRLPSPYHPSDPHIRELDLDRISPAFREDFIDSYASRNDNININSSRISQTRENIIRGGPRNEGHDDGGYRHGNGCSPDRHQYAPSSERFLRDLELGLGSRSPREDLGGDYESRCGEKERSWKRRDEDFQRVRSWVPRRDEVRRRLLHDTVKDGDFGGNRDEIPSVSGRDERNSYEPGKSSGRGIEFREEFIQPSSPMKQVQKKSVLLRIGKPNNASRNRSRDENFSKGYFDDPTNSSFKGKDKERESVLCLDQPLEEEKVGRPVELNVSFKSNALVAKAVVPPSSSAGGSDRNFTPPRNRKIRRITESNSPLTRAGVQFVKSDSSSLGSDCPSSSEKTLKKLAKNYNVCGDGPVWNMNSLQYSTATNDSTRNGALSSPSGSITDQGRKGRSYDESRSDKMRKKRKAILLAADASMPQPTREDSKPVEGYKYSPSALDRGAMQDVPFASLNGTSIVEMEKPPKPIIQGKDGTDNNTVSPCELDTERNSLSHLASLSGSQINKIDQLPENTDTSVPDFQFISNSETILSEIQSESTECNIDGMEDVNLSPSHLQLLENDKAKVSLEGVVTVEGSDHDVLPSREEIQFHESPPVGSSAIASATFKGPGSFDESSTRQEISSIVDMSSIGSKTYCLNELTTVSPDGVAEDLLNAVPANAEEIKAREDLSDLVSLNQNPSLTSSFIGELTNTQAEKIISDTSTIGDTGKLSFFDGASELLENDLVEGSPLHKILTGDSQSVSSSQGYQSDGLDLELGASCPRICQTHENVGRPMLDIDATLSYSLKDVAITEDKVSQSREENVAAVQAIKEHDSHYTEIDNLKTSSAIEILSPDWTLPRTVIESNILEKDDGLHMSNIPSVCADDASLSATKANDKYVPVKLINLVAPETVSDSSDSCTLNNKSLDCMTSSQKLGEYGNELHEKPLSGGGSVVSSSNTVVNNFKSNVTSSPAKVTAVAINAKTALSASEVSNKTTQNLNSGKEVMHAARNQPTAASGVPRVFTGPSPSVFTNSSAKAPAQKIAKTRTWHRTGKASNFPLPVKKSFSSPVPPPPKRVGVAQSSSYIRTGNSLVRKPTSATSIPSGTPASSSSMYKSSPSCIDEAKKSAGSKSKVNVIGAVSSLSTGGLAAPIERPKTPPVFHSSKSSDCIPIYSGDVTSLPPNCPPLDGSRIIANHLLTNQLTVPKTPEENMNYSGIPEHQTSLTSNSESRNVRDEGNLEKKIHDVKRKSNQLVAASNSGDPSVLDLETQASLSDGYYKRRKNQLIRTSTGTHVMQRVASPDDPVYSEMQQAAEVYSSKILSKKQSNKGKAKIYKPSRFSSVWTLNNQSSRKNGVPLHCQKVRPHLIPWKRVKDWRSFMSISGFSSNNSSLSLISRKLLLSRKRDTIYTRSAHGFSLHMSKLLSVGGSSLKWSKSIEKNSKRANEEATLAVAAVEKEKREQNDTSCLVPGSKSRNYISRKSIRSIELHPGERIFRIGLVRYRMDPSKRTLQRISDEEPSTSRQSGKEGKRTYVPRRLLIGHDEYVRIGNGNQLVRDPKKRTRIFANEKVRWSLHTARLRLARKRKYCQFFTRFGKCNKDGSKCPFIHDPTKIAVCTKFLNGSCSDPNCKLTHKVIPERMQDCSYFLQGLCSNEHCPYRHVNVNTNASVCEGFLKGYCADGNECRKKHTYVCPIFEATGICPQGSTCKLHHPKKRSGLKRKLQSREQQQKNAQGRYFGSKRNSGVVVAEGVAASPGNLGLKDDDDDIFSQDGKFSDYINIDMSDEETEGNCDLTSEQRTICTDPSDLQVVDIDDIIKPIGIMNKNLTTESLLAIDSPSEKSASFLSEESDGCK